VTSSWEVTVEGSSSTTRQGLISAECAAEDKGQNDKQTVQAFATAQAAAKRDLGYIDSVQLLGSNLDEEEISDKVEDEPLDKVDVI
jgi:hypothetical protein